MSPTLDRTQAVIAETAARSGPAVLGLGRGWGDGSGVVAAEGRVLTNAHNLPRGAPPAPRSWASMGCCWANTVRIEERDVTASFPES